jgi:hypothetical protein
VARGCKAPAPSALFTLDGEDIRRCPLALLTEETCRVLDLYPYFENGMMPVAGGVLDQSATFLEAVRLLRAEVAEHRATHPR